MQCKGKPKKDRDDLLDQVKMDLFPHFHLYSFTTKMAVLYRVANQMSISETFWLCWKRQQKIKEKQDIL